MADTLTNSYDDLLPVYGPGTDEAKTRYAKIKQAFEDRFGASPELFARSPGRVNLIGEHIDYEGYGVLPMAIGQDTVVAIRKAGDALVLSNLESTKYPDVTFSIDPDQEVDVGKHNWGNYFLGAYKGVFEHLQAKNNNTVPTPVGLEVMIHGRVPTGSGLSSSAAIVCAAALGIMAVHGIELTKGEVSEFTAKAEQYVGVTSGGMDQAISIMGRPGIAQHVEFNPVRGTDVVLPSDATFVIANSLAVSNKAESATGRYNLRVVECRLAAVVLAVLLGESKENARALQTLKEAEMLIDSKYTGDKGENDANLASSAVAALLHDAAYDTAEIESLIGCSLTDLYQGNASALRVIAAHTSWKLQQRAAHVYSEKQRVVDFAAVCSDSAKAQDEVLQALGQLMDSSQASCRDLFECSCPELDALVAVAKQSGAIGSRLTGAGWGGCTVSLVKKADTEAFLKAVTEQYYQPLIKEGKLQEEALGETIFASSPGSGGAVLRLKQ